MKYFRTAALLVTATLGQLAIGAETEQRKPGPLERFETVLAELQALRYEIEELSRGAGHRKQIIVALQCVEIDLAKMKAAGLKFPGPTLEDGQPEKPFSNGFPKPLLASLVENDAARILSESTLVAVPGQKAHFESGGELPQGDTKENEPAKRWGTTVDLLGTLTDDNRINLELRMCQTTLDQANFIVDEGHPQPAARRQIFDTGFEVASGETFTIGGLTSVQAKRKDQDDQHAGDETRSVWHMWIVTTEIAHQLPGDFRPEASDAEATQAKGGAKKQR